jgi:hypothetical protein
MRHCKAPAWFLTCWLALSATATAQPPQTGDAPRSGIVYQGPNPWVEGFFVLVPCAALLYAVCRSSRRN